MGRCDQMVESGIVAYGCYLDSGHDGPHAAVEVTRSVEQRSVWERNQATLAAVDAVTTPVIVAEDLQPVEVVPPLEQLQGTPQTFWQAHSEEESMPVSPPQEATMPDSEETIDIREVEAIVSTDANSIQLEHVIAEVERLIREEAARGQITPPALADTIARGVWEFLEMVYANGVTDGVFAERGRVMQRVFGDA